MRMNTRPREPDPGEGKTFEQALSEIEAIVHELEEGKISLSKSLERFEEGVRLIDFCNRVLGDAERRIELLLGTDAQGRPLTRPFDTPGEEPRGEEGSRARRRRRGAHPAAGGASNPGPSSGDMDEGESLF